MISGGSLVSSFFKNKSNLGATCSFKENMTNFENLLFWIIQIIFKSNLEKVILLYRGKRKDLEDLKKGVI